MFHFVRLAERGVCKISSVACGFSPIKIDYSDYLKSLISRINVLAHQIGISIVLHMRDTSMPHTRASHRES